MTKILGLSGSLRAGSFNAGLLQAAVEVAPDGVEVIAGSIHGVPLYDGDLEAASGIPAEVTALKDALKAADGLLLVTPEYNNGIPGVFKNVIDWMSRPANEIGAVFGGKPVAVIGASAGGFGTVLAQNDWLPVLRTLGTSPWFGGRLMVSRSGNLFDEQGNLKDDSTRENLRRFIAGFGEFISGTEG